MENTLSAALRDSFLSFIFYRALLGDTVLNKTACLKRVIRDKCWRMYLWSRFKFKCSCYKRKKNKGKKRHGFCKSANFEESSKESKYHVAPAKLWAMLLRKAAGLRCMQSSGGLCGTVTASLSKHPPWVSSISPGWEERTRASVGCPLPGSGVQMAGR